MPEPVFSAPDRNGENLQAGSPEALPEADATAPSKDDGGGSPGIDPAPPPSAALSILTRITAALFGSRGGSSDAASPSGGASAETTAVPAGPPPGAVGETPAAVPAASVAAPAPAVHAPAARPTAAGAVAHARGSASAAAVAPPRAQTPSPPPVAATPTTPPVALSGAVQAVTSTVTPERVRRIVERVSPPAAAAAKVAVDAGRSPWFPAGLLIATVLYLLGQRRLDRGAKLKYAGRPGDADDEMIEL